MTIKKKKLITNIIFYTLIVFIYAIVLFGVITKFTGGSVFLGNLRADVVLTDSMSKRNPSHLDFLEGTTQFQPHDVVFSNRIDESTELFVKDCVLFRSPNYHNQFVVHRIVNIEEKGTELVFNKYNKATINDMDAVTLEPTGLIKMIPLDFNSIKIDFYTTISYSQYIVLQVNKSNVEYQIETTKIRDDLYHHIVTYTKSNDYTYQSVIGRYSLNVDIYITSITYVSKTKGTEVVEATKIPDPVVDPDSGQSVYTYLAYAYKLYEIRADKGYSSDGKFKKEDLVSRVHTVWPWVGHIIQFLQSIPGIIMMVGLAIIITVTSFLLNKTIKKEQANAVNNCEVVENQIEEKKIESTIDKKKRDKSDKNSE